LEERLRVKQVGGVLSFTLQLGKCVWLTSLVQKDKEDLQEILNDLEELELMDEDAKVP
jgi:hypothetical protein